MTNPTTSTSPSTSTAPTAPRFRYTAALAHEIEGRWQKRWDDTRAFATRGPGDEGFDPSRPKFYCLDMFPYPSGAGLHVGHPEGYTATDIICRYHRLRGDNVLHPMGWDAFGLPAEQYAIQTGVHPAQTTRAAIDNFRRQLKRFGFSYDWEREFATIDEDYYRWTQWIWLKAYDAWYDPEADAARPVDELTAGLAAGRLVVDGDGRAVPRAAATGSVRTWSDLDDDARRAVVDDHRLAYLGEQTVNWCPRLGTVLANEEVIDGRSERGGYPVLRKPLRQWMFRITAYADRLLRDLDAVDWPESTRTMQREWIGRSEGAEIDFPLIDAPANGGASLRVYTTRPDTIFGATYMVVAPEHPLVEAMLAAPKPGTDVDRVRAYVAEARDRADLDRMADTQTKTGVDTGFTAENPATGDAIPIWVADYVLMGYGHGAIMAVPAHDERDFAFARAFGLPIRQVVEPVGAPYDPDEAFSGTGRAVHSTGRGVSLDGQDTDHAKDTLIAWLEATGRGRRRVNFRLRDWLFSRQRYWGEPFPIVFDEAGHHYPVHPDHLPVVLPDLADYEPVESDDPQPLLAKATDWVETTAGAAGVSADVLPPDTPVRRETNTMPGWAGSCWYYLRYCASDCPDRFVDADAERYWMLSRRDGAPTGTGAFDPAVHHVGGVDLYVGGAEHAVLHLLYARFWHKVLFDLGEVSTPEPMGKLFHQGMITSYAYQRDDRSLVPIDEVDEAADGTYVERATGAPVTQVVAKMSKSLKNVVNPDDVIAEFGADTFRLYEMYMGPLEATKSWNTRDMVGLFRFLQRTWRLVADEDTGARHARVVDRAEVSAADADRVAALDRALHRAIAGVTADIEKIRLNTAIAKLIELTNALVASDGPVPVDILERFTVILAPFAPHLAEEQWRVLGHDDTLADATWPTWDEALLADDMVEIPVQVLGKVRGKITVPADADAAAIEAAAIADDRIREVLAGRAIRKVVVVKGKIVNIVV